MNKKSIQYLRSIDVDIWLPRDSALFKQQEGNSRIETRRTTTSEPSKIPEKRSPVDRKTEPQNRNQSRDPRQELVLALRLSHIGSVSILYLNEDARLQKLALATTGIRSARWRRRYETWLSSVVVKSTQRSERSPSEHE